MANNLGPVAGHFSCFDKEKGSSQDIKIPTEATESWIMQTNLKKRSAQASYYSEKWFSLRHASYLFTATNADGKTFLRYQGWD